MSPIPKVWGRNVLRKRFSSNEFGPSLWQGASVFRGNSARLYGRVTDWRRCLPDGAIPGESVGLSPVSKRPREEPESLALLLNPCIGTSTARIGRERISAGCDWELVMDLGLRVNGDCLPVRHTAQRLNIPRILSDTELLISPSVTTT